MANPRDTIRQDEKTEREALQVRRIWFRFESGKLYNEERRVDGIKFVDRSYEVLCVFTAVDDDGLRWVAFCSAPDWWAALLSASRKLRGNLLDWREDTWRNPK